MSTLIRQITDPARASFGYGNNYPDGSIGETFKNYLNQIDSLKGSALVGNLPRWVGAVGRKVQDTLEDSVNVWQFCTPSQKLDILNGVAAFDCAPIFQKALEAGEACVKWGRGTFPVMSAISVPQGVTLKGGNRYGSKIKVNGSGYDAITLAGNGSTFDGGSFTSATARTAGAYVKLAPNKRGQNVLDFLMERHHTGIVVSDGCVISELKGGEMLEAAATTGINIDILGGNDTYLESIVGDANSSPLAGIRIRKTDAVWMSDVDMIRCGINLLIDPDGALGQYITWIFGVNCAFDSSATQEGALIRPKNGGVVRGFQMVSPWFATNKIGMRLATDGAPGSVIDGVQLIAPRLLNNQQQGFVSDGGPNIVNVSVLEPTSSGNSQETTGVYPGIEFKENSRIFTVRGGKSGASLGFPVSQRSGVRLGANCTDYEVSGVDMTANAITAFENQSLGTANGRVRDNAGAKTKNTGQANFSAGATELTIEHGLIGPPSSVLVTPVNTNLMGLSYWAGSFSQTTAKINLSAPVMSAGAFTWVAEIY